MVKVKRERFYQMELFLPDFCCSLSFACDILSYRTAGGKTAYKEHYKNRKQFCHPVCLMSLYTLSSEFFTPRFHRAKRLSVLCCKIVTPTVTYSDWKILVLTVTCKEL